MSILAFCRHEVLANAAREGARVAVLPGYATTDVQDRVMSYVTAGGLPTTAGNPTVTVSPATVPWDTTTWPATTVSVAYTDDYLFLNGVVGWFGGSLGATTLQSQATMRNELGS